MARNLGLGIVVVAVLAAVVWLLGGAAGLFGTGGGTEVGGDGSGAPREATTSEPGAQEGAAVAPAPVLAARRPERRGIGSLSARVVDAKEAPLAGAAVRVTGTGHGDEVVALDAASDAEGHVVFASVPAGVGYVVRVEAKGQPPVTVPDVEVRAGRRKDLGAILVGARAALAGRVVDEKGAAVAGADVRAFRGHENLLELFGNMVELFVTLGREPTALAKATSDADGRFTLPDLPPGRVIVRATTAKRRAGFVDAQMTAEGPAEGPVTIRLEPGAVVAGVVVDAAGSPVPGATLAFLSQSGEADSSGDQDPFDFFTRRVFAVTDAKGAFSTRVAEGAKDLRAVVEAAGFPTTASREFAAGDTAVRIVLARGAVLEVTALDAATGRPVPGAQAVAMISEGKSFDEKETGGGILYGVTDDRGVVALPTGPGQVGMLIVQHPSYAASMTSPAQADAMRAMGSPLADDGSEVPKEVKAGETARATVRLKAGVRLVGRVTDGTGAPIPGVEVKAVAFMGSGGGTASRTDADGQYVLQGLTGMMGQVPAMVSYRAPGWVPATETITLTPDVVAAGEARQDVTMRRAATLRGRVLDEEGKPVLGARVRHTGLAGGFDLDAMFGGSSGSLTDAQGAYVLTEVPPADAAERATPPAGADGDEPGTGLARRLADGMSELRVAATADGFVPGRSAPLKVREGEEIEVPAIRLSRGAVARGVVRLPGGRAAGGARVESRLDPEAGPADMADIMRAAMMTGRLARTVRADAEGRFEISGLAPGTLTLVARAEGFAPSRRKAKVATEPLEVEVLLRPASDLSGRVHGSDGRPLAGAAVTVEGDLAGVEGDEGYVEHARVVTDTEGRFTLKALPAGSVPVVVRADGHQRATLRAVPGGAPLDVRLEARRGGRSKEEIQKDIQKVSMEMAGATDDDARQAAQRRLMDLMREMQEDDSGDEPMGATPAIPEEPSR